MVAVRSRVGDAGAGVWGRGRGWRAQSVDEGSESPAQPQSAILPPNDEGQGAAADSRQDAGRRRWQGENKSNYPCPSFLSLNPLQTHCPLVPQSGAVSSLCGHETSQVTSSNNVLKTDETSPCALFSNLQKSVVLIKVTMRFILSLESLESVGKSKVFFFSSDPNTKAQSTEEIWEM